MPDHASYYEAIPAEFPYAGSSEADRQKGTTETHQQLGPSSLEEDNDKAFNLSGSALFSDETLRTRTGPYGRLGTIAVLIIIIGTILELGILGFLAFIWAGRGQDPDGGAASNVWRVIMLKNWVSRAVTLSALVLRSAISFQATIATGLVAALMLEARQVPLSELGRFSILRAVNGGPWTIMQPLVQGSHYRSFRSLPAILVVLLLVLSIAVQFSSTLLLSDFRQIGLVGYPEAGRTPVLEANPEMLFATASSNTTTTGQAAWTQCTNNFPPFAESARLDRLTGPNISDTGTIKRGFLPFQTQDRQHLRRYAGPGVTHESRVTCVRPTLAARLVDGNNTDWFIRGNLSWDFRDPGLNKLACGFEAACPPVQFNCGLPFNGTSDVQSSILSHVPTSLCVFNESSYSYNVAPRDLRSVFLLLNTTATQNDWDIIGAGTLPRTSGAGEWDVYRWVNNETNVPFTLNATVCLSTAHIALENVFYSSEADPQEPALNYDSAAAAWTTDPVLNMVNMMGQSGPDKAAAADRGILTIESATVIPPDQVEAMYKASGNFHPETFSANETVDFFASAMLQGFEQGLFDFQNPANLSIYFNTNNLVAGNWIAPHPSYVILFHAIMDKAAGGPAAAMHSIFFWLAQAQYYQALPGFDFGANATVVRSLGVLIPGAWGGFVAVVAIVLLDIACVLVVTALFLRRTAFSIYGNAWHAIAQVVSPEMHPIFESAACLPDREVNRNLEQKIGRSSTFGVGRVKSGRVTVLRRDMRF